jgi:hypothetical protein
LAPLGQVGQTLQVAMRDPFDTGGLALLRGQAGLDVQPVLADEHSLRHFVERCHAGADELSRTAGRAIEAVLQDEELAGRRRNDAVEQEVREAAVPAFVHEVLHDARRRRASDVHFEPFEDHTRVRYRIDGKLVVTDRVVLRLPIIGPLAQVSSVSSFMGLFSMLLATNAIQEAEAIELAAQTARNSSVAARLATAALDVAAGTHKVSGALRKTGVVPPVYVQILRTGEAKPRGSLRT